MEVQTTWGGIEAALGGPDERVLFLELIFVRRSQVVENPHLRACISGMTFFPYAFLMNLHKIILF